MGTILIMVVGRIIIIKYYSSGRDEKDKKNASTSNRYNDTTNHDDADGYIMIGKPLRLYPIISSIGMLVR